MSNLNEEPMPVNQNNTKSRDVPDVYEAEIDDALVNKALNATPLLCRSKVRKFVLDEAAATRTHHFTRVSEGTILSAQEHLKMYLRLVVSRAPSAGRTL